MNHSFEVAVAQDFDVDTAIFLNNMVFWIQRNCANRRHYHDGTYWTYNSYNAFTEIFSYWTYKQMRRIIDNAVARGLIIKGNYNKKAYDETNWYALTDLALAYYPLLRDQLLNTPAQTGTPPAQTGRPIPDSKPDKFNTSACGAKAAGMNGSITPIELVSIFTEELPESPAPLVHATKGHIGCAEKRAIKLLKEHFEGTHKKPFTGQIFRGYLRYLKDNCSGFINNEYEQRGSGKYIRNGFLQIVNWQNYEKAFNQTLK